MIQEYLFDRQVPEVFVPLIPHRYAMQIERGELLAVGAYDTWEEAAAGVIVFRQQEGWMELVWLFFSEAYRDSEDALQFVAHRLEQAKQAGILNGAFIDFVNEQEAAPVAWMLKTLGFRRDLVSDHVYELTLADVKNAKVLHRQIPKHMKTLQNVNKEMRKKLVKAIAADPRAIPLAMPVDWRLYDEAISVVYMDQTRPEGVLLFERVENDLIFSCAWSKETKVLAGMLVLALSQAEEYLPEDTNLLIPVLDQRVAALVERIVPTAACRMIDEWSLGFRI